MPEEGTYEVVSVALMDMSDDNISIIHSAYNPPFIPALVAPMFLPVPSFLVDTALRPLRMVKWDLHLLTFSPNLEGAYRTRVEKSGPLSIGAASLRDKIESKQKRLVDYTSSMGSLSKNVEPQVSFRITGIDLIKALWSLVVNKTIRIRSRAVITGNVLGVLPYSKTFDIDATIPTP